MFLKESNYYVAKSVKHNDNVGKICNLSKYRSLYTD